MDGPRRNGSLRDAAAPGGRFAGNGANGVPYTTCVSMTRSHIRNVRFGAIVMGNNLLFSRQRDRPFRRRRDRLRRKQYLDHAQLHPRQLRHRRRQPRRRDARAKRAAPTGVPYNAFSNILIDSNLVIRQTDPKLAFPTYLQGIDAFDEDWTNVTVTNNVIVTSACWGIFYASVHGGKIINNTASSTAPTRA